MHPSILIQKPLIILIITYTGWTNDLTSPIAFMYWTKTAIPFTYRAGGIINCAATFTRYAFLQRLTAPETSFADLRNNRGEQ